MHLRRWRTSGIAVCTQRALLRTDAATVRPPKRPNLVGTHRANVTYCCSGRESKSQSDSHTALNSAAKHAGKPCIASGSVSSTGCGTRNSAERCSPRRTGRAKAPRPALR